MKVESDCKETSLMRQKITGLEKLLGPYVHPKWQWMATECLKSGDSSFVVRLKPMLGPQPGQG